MWFRLLVISLLALTVTATGAASHPVSHSSANGVQIGPAMLLAGNHDATSVAGGQPLIDFSRRGVTGLAPDTHLVIGDIEHPRADHAFTLVNEADRSISVTIGYRYDQPPTKLDAVRIVVVDSAGSVVSETDRGSMSAFTLASGQSVYLIVSVDTSDMSPDADLSGTVTFVIE